MTLRELGEERLLAQILTSKRRSARMVGGANDDCAVLTNASRDSNRLLLLKTDAVVEGIHFQPSATPAAVGWKAMSRPLSDIAAMSGIPEFALVTLGLPPATQVRWVREFYQGLRRAAERWKIALVGGETTATCGEKMIAVTISGRVERKRCVFRSGGKAGDALFVTGRLGGALRGKHLTFLPRIAESRWLTTRFPLHAMMDLSDGLAVDLPRLARASGLGFSLEEEQVPRGRGCSLEEAIGDGEDYELLFALPEAERPSLERAWQRRFPRLPLSHIGRLEQESTDRVRKLPGGYDHFQKRG